jgi:HK97 gp10 family phage protein
MSSSNSQNYGDIMIKEFNERFSPEKIRAVMQAALDAGFSIMQDATPVKTGNLKASEGISVIGDGTKGEMHANAEYAGYVNNGTSRQRPQPFFDRGVAVTTQKLKDGCASL